MLIKKNDVTPNTYSLLSINDNKIIDITKIVDKDKDFRHLTVNVVMCVNYTLYGIVKKNIFCKVKIYYDNNYIIIEVIHYDIKSNMKEIDKMVIRVMYCLYDCVKHDSTTTLCTTSDNRNIGGPTFCLENIDKYQYIIGLRAGNNYKICTPHHFNIETLEDKIIFDGYCIGHVLGNFILFHKNNQVCIYNYKNSKEIVVDSDQIVSQKNNDTSTSLLGYTHNGQYKYLLLPLTKTDDTTNTINFSTTFKNNKIIITAKDRFNEYDCTLDTYESYKFLNSMEMMYEIIKDAIDATDNNVTMTYSSLDDKLEVEITINIKYIMDKINFVLIKKAMDKLEIMDKKINYLYDVNKIQLL